jgi:predicted anti-sigma-YlaC factor YlaD
LATDCAQARESVSLQLDGELSEFDLDRLETHLRICPACEAWADQVRDVTRQLRAASLELPEERFVLPRAGRRWTVSSAVALASAAAIVATMFVAPRPHRAAVGLHLRGASSRFASAAPQVFEARTVPLEDGIFTAVSVNTLHSGFRPV